MEQSLDGRCFFNSIPNATILGAKGKSGRYLLICIASLFLSVFPPKKLVAVSL
jgi:hypothetical protein